MSFVVYQIVYGQTPSQRGYNAAFNDYPKSANPYDKGTPKYHKWLNGYADGLVDMQNNITEPDPILELCH